MYDPIVGKYVLDNWEKITSVVKNQRGIIEEK